LFVLCYQPLPAVESEAERLLLCCRHMADLMVKEASGTTSDADEGELLDRLTQAVFTICNNNALCGYCSGCVLKWSSGAAADKH